jgi:protein-S-isoprenylcysteine O-methyltransferase Ste14
MNPHRMNLVLRTLVWLGGLAWWVYLRKPAGPSLLELHPGFATGAGIALTIVGVTLYLWAAGTLASGVPSAMAPPAELLMRGPYRYVRNPLYLAVAAIFLGVSTLYAPWRTRDLLRVGIVAILLHVFVLRREEPATRRRLGPVYDEYCARVPRWIPRFSTHH